MQEAVRSVSERVEYADSLYTDIRFSAVTKDSTEEKLSMPLVGKGVVFRILKGGEWREAAFGRFDRSTILQGLRSLAEFTPASNSGNGIVRGEPWKTDVTLAGRRDPRSVGLEEKLEVVRRNYEIAKSYDQRIINVISGYREIIEERAYVNSEGSDLHEVLSRIYYSLSAIAREGDRIEYDYCHGGKTGGFETVEELFDDSDIKEVSRSAISLLGSHQVPSGTFKVVLDPGMTGTFAHESFGHGCEADQVLRGRSYLVNHLEEKLGPEDFNLFDDGTMNDGAGSIVFDDEGNKPQKTPIVEDGKLVHFLQDRTTAKEMDERPTGNARRESYKRMVYVRMTNTCIDPGDFTLEELLKETGEGFLLEHWNSGIEDPIGGNMQLKCKKARRIKNGELSEPFSTTVVSGKVLDFMRNIKGITGSSDFMTDPGFCGKGTEDHVTVGSGGSFLASVATIGQG